VAARRRDVLPEANPKRPSGRTREALDRSGSRSVVGRRRGSKPQEGRRSREGQMPISPLLETLRFGRLSTPSGGARRSGRTSRAVPACRLRLSVASSEEREGDDGRSLEEEGAPDVRVCWATGSGGEGANALEGKRRLRRASTIADGNPRPRCERTFSRSAEEGGETRPTKPRRREVTPVGVRRQWPREGYGLLEGESSGERIPRAEAARNKAAKPRGGANRQEVEKA
jgi:hypothetical protein